jgi:hypothetical protein
VQGIISALKESNLFTSINVIDLIDEESVKLLKLKAMVRDASVLYITKLHTPDGLVKSRKSPPPCRGEG